MAVLATRVGDSDGAFARCLDAGASADKAAFCTLTLMNGERDQNGIRLRDTRG